MSRQLISILLDKFIGECSQVIPEHSVDVLNAVNVTVLSSGQRSELVSALWTLSDKKTMHYEVVL